MPVCNRICVRYKLKNRKTKFWYTAGVKRCSICEIFIVWDGLRCPCCDTKLSTKPSKKPKQSDVQNE